MDKDLEQIVKNFLVKDKEFEEYVNLKCMKAVSECREYIEKEYSNQYDEDELSIIREKLIFKTGYVAALQMVFGYNKI